MPANKFAFLRYQIIDDCLRNTMRPYPKLRDLRRACEEKLFSSEGERISDSAIEKDLKAMLGKNSVKNSILLMFANLGAMQLLENYLCSLSEQGINKYLIYAMVWTSQFFSVFFYLFFLSSYEMFCSVWKIFFTSSRLLARLKVVGG